MTGKQTRERRTAVLEALSEAAEAVRYTRADLLQIRSDVAELIGAAWAVGQWSDEFLCCASTQLEADVKRLRAAYYKVQP